MINLETLLANFLSFLPSLITALVIFVISLYIAGMARKAVRRGLSLHGGNQKLNEMLAKITRFSIIVLGLIVALQQVGFNVSAFLAGLGIMGFTIGFALQDVSKNFVAGLLLYIQQPFDIGDAIEVSGYSGVVEEIDLRATEIRTFDGKLVLIPNSDVFTSAITNFSAFPTRRLDIVIGVAYDTDLEKARQIIIETISSLEGVLDDPAPSVIYNKFNDSSIDLTLYFWIDVNRLGFLAAQDNAVTRIKLAFEQAGIEIPFPTTTVLMPENQPPEAYN